MTLADLVVDLYLRKSSADRGKSVASQETELTDGIEEDGHQVGRSFTDDNRSASRYRRRERESFPRLIEHIRSGRCQCLGVWEVSRSSRELSEFVQLLDLLRERGVLVYVYTHGRIFDPRKRGDYKTLATEGLDAADESERIAERTRRGKRIAAQAGTPAGHLVYGYRRIYDDAGHYVEQVEEPTRAAVVREIVDRVAAGKEAVSAIARDLNGRGVPTPQAGPWLPSTVRQVTRNIAYIGRRIHQGRDFGPAAWPAIVDEATWRRAVARLADPSRRSSRGQALTYFLTAVPRCGTGDCAGVLVTRGRDRHGFRRYACGTCTRSSIVADPMDELVDFMMRERLRRRDALPVFAAPVDDAELDAAEAEQDELTGRLKIWRKSAAAGKTTPETMAEIEAELAPQITAVAERVRQLRTPPALAHLADVEDLAEAWPDLPVADRRRLTLALAEIVVRPARRGVYRGFDRWRLRDSRWRGDPLTWGEHWASAVQD